MPGDDRHYPTELQKVLWSRCLPSCLVQSVPLTRSGNAIPEDTTEVSSSKDTQKGEKESSPSVNLPPDQLILSWLKELKIYGSKDPVKASSDLALLVPHIHSKSDLKDLYTFAQDHIYGQNKTVFLGNLAGSVEDWMRSLDSGAKPQENALNATMNKRQAEAFAMSLLSTFPAELLAIDQSYPDDDQIWSTCVQYAADRWVYFGSPAHYANPSEWESARIEQAIAYGQSTALQATTG